MTTAYRSVGTGEISQAGTLRELSSSIFGPAGQTAPHGSGPGTCSQVLDVTFVGTDPPGWGTGNPRNVELESQVGRHRGLFMYHDIAAGNGCRRVVELIRDGDFPVNTGSLFIDNFAVCVEGHLEVHFESEVNRCVP
jgi:hypothetical protein